ncbi:acyl-CoA dehydrogenase family protein [Actinoplanes derwentensis]|uniref:Acyl-CoA dehydrogenase n=1 Tax=Actinoplanes derwentensis TaxID=113562 RepID=A0A1H2B225_9ACTN|nr:acyl-CoA dehydrogenase family protein [Actinoplanes derwentensis]GID87584.1 acyl-CoA dehydrogenase [Actinoplanes derwentensis]SDT52223.1 Acyl-CoA dehydrogenase [Actinoplanes derwentensis]
MSAEQAALRDSVRRLLAGHGDDPGLWGRLCEQIGVGGLTVPEEYGGSGATLAEASVVLEECGRVLSPVPALGSLLASHALQGAGPETRARLLPPLCAGDRIVALAWHGSAVVTGDRITGTFRDVLDTAAADTLLIATAGEIAEVTGAVLEPQNTLDLSRPLTMVRLDEAPIVWRDASHTVPGLRDLACSALAAEQVGTAERALELTVEYVKVRHQFGRPIGSFQVLQHRLADLYVRVQAARSVITDPTVGKVWCSETLRAVAAEMTQMHGGIAITWEHDAHRYLRRAWASAELFGSPAEHVARLAPEFLDT